VRDQVVEDGAPAECVGRGDRDQHEAGVRDRGVREQPLDVPLHECGDVADGMKAVTGVGAPVYASGVHMWKGAADVLNASPAITIARPSTSSESCEWPAAPILSKPSSPVEP